MTNRCLVSVGGLLAAKHAWSVNLNYVTDSVPSSTVAQTIANAIMTAINGSTTLKGALNTADTYQTVRVTGYPALTGPASVSAVSTNSPVSGTTSVVSGPQMCVGVTLRSATPGRSFRGRLYLPQRFGTVNSDGTINGATATSAAGIVNALNDAILTAFTASSVAASWVVYSKTKPAATPVTSLSVGNMGDTQRRRVEAKETYTNFPLT